MMEQKSKANNRQPLATGQHLRIGVFVCHCGKNIGGYLDVPEVTRYAESLPNVAYSCDDMYMCSETGLKVIYDAIKEHKLNRVVVAACTPRTHEYIFRAACQDAGLNPYLFEFANIRDQCSWVHMSEWDGATQKAKDLVRMSVARAALLSFKEEVRVDVRSIALVIGGGPAGMSAAVSLARRGFKVKLVEKEDELGGMLKYLNKLYPTHEDASEVMDRMIKAVTEHRNIEVFTSAEVTEVGGFIGNFDVNIRQNGKEITLGTGVIILATGAQEFVPRGLYGFDGKIVVTQLGLERLLKEGKMNANNVVMMQCVGARDETRPYCSKICCTNAIKNAILIKEANPKSKIFIIYRDIQTYGAEYEEYYAKARELGVMFVKYIPDRRPEYRRGFLIVYDDLLGENLGMNFDMLVLSTPLIANDDAVEISKMLKVPLDRYNFFLEAHVKLRPVDFAANGVYVCGSARWPAHIGEAVAQGFGAAMRASAHLTKGYVVEEPLYAMVDADKCHGCGLCERICSYGAPRVEETDKGLKARIEEILCKGCGLCNATCPHNAVTMSHFTDEQYEAQIIAGLGGR